MHPCVDIWLLLLQSPTGLITGMAQGTTSLVSNTVYALSDAATQFSKAAQKVILPLLVSKQIIAWIKFTDRTIDCS